MTRDLRSVLLAGLWGASLLVLFDLSRTSPALVPSQEGWRWLGEIVVLGAAIYVPACLLPAAALFAAARWLDRRPAAGLSSPTYLLDRRPAAGLSSPTSLLERRATSLPRVALVAGAAAGSAAWAIAMGSLGTRPGAPSAWTAAWLLDAALATLFGVAAGVAAARCAIAASRSVRRASWLTAMAAAPVLPLLAGAIPAIAAAGSPWGGRPMEPSRSDLPDVVLLLADTLRADALSCYGGRLATPQIDSIAAGGVRFTRATAQASWTNPSTATLLTSLEPHDHGVVGYRGRMKAGVRTLAQTLASRGYATAGLVANPVVSRIFGFDRGFDLWDQDPDPRLLARHPEILGAGLLRSAGFGRPTILHAEAGEMIDRALATLSRGDAGRPRFLYLHLMDPHDPYTPPPDLARSADPDYTGSLVFRGGTLYEILRGELAVTDRDLRHARALYEAEVAAMDAEVGRLLEALRRRAESRPVLVVFTADHGEEFMDHGELGHEHSLYQELIHVPLMAQLLGRLDGDRDALPAGTIVDRPVRLMDVSPTILALAGLPPEPGFRGRDLLSTDSKGASDPIYSEEDYVGYRTPAHRMRAAREGDWKVILYQPNVFGLGPWRREAFDLAADPGESSSRASGAPEADRLEAWLRGKIETQAGVSAVESLDPETERRLRALGYIQ